MSAGEYVLVFLVDIDVKFGCLCWFGVCLPWLREIACWKVNRFMIF